MSFPALKTFLFLALVIAVSYEELKADVVISEFVASNSGGLVDEDGASSDWIELYNSGSSTVNLNQWRLTDDAGNLAKWRLPSVNIAPGGYLVVFASGKDRQGAELHTNFELARSGGYLALLPPSGVATSEFFPNYPKQEAGVSYGDSAGEFGYFVTQTPGAANSAQYEGLLSDTKFTQGRGFYYAPFVETISCEDAGATLIYTFDGSEPSLTNGVQVPPADGQSAPTVDVSISSTTVLRVIAVKNNYRSTNIDTVTYLFPRDVLSQDDQLQGRQLPVYPFEVNFGTYNWSYEMDQNIVNDPRFSDLANDLLTLPTMSIVMPVEDIWGSSGILSNPEQRGSAWERGCSVEIINPLDSTEYQIDAGLRVQGQSSRGFVRGKKSLRLAFRKEYGESRFEYPLWGATGASEAATISLRGNLSDSWSDLFDSSGHDDTGRSSGLLMRSHFATVTHARMGGHAVSSGWVHLYINGKYWGVYNPVERADREFAALHGGGDEGDYFRLGVADTEGDSTDWDALEALVRGYTSSYDDAKHQAIVSQVEVDSLIDYLMTNFWMANLDWSNNWIMLRNNKTDGPFRFYMWDADQSLYFNFDTTGDGGLPATNIHEQLSKSAEYRLQFADRVHALMFNDGVLATANIQQFFQSQADAIQAAMNCESARWGDEYTPGSPHNTVDDWLPHVNNRKNVWMPNRHTTVITGLRNRGLYPTTEAPVLSQHGGSIVAGAAITLTNPNQGGVVYYTLDGSDPRLAGGAVSGAAQTYVNAVTLAGNAELQSRVLDGGVWSALTKARFSTGVQPSPSTLVTSEIHYHPTEPTAAEEAAGFTDADDFEFIELINVGNTVLDLSDLRFDRSVEGIGFDFSTVSNPLLEPAGRLLLVKNRAAYAFRYGGGVVPAGEYAGKLSNGGETLTLTRADGSLFKSFTYNDKYPWPETADGGGASLVLVEPTQSPNLSDGGSWMPSVSRNGSPGGEDTLPDFPADPSADADGNGVLDIIDYAISGQPAAATLSEGDDDYVTITFTANPGAGRAALVVQHSEDLVQWVSTAESVSPVSETLNTDGSVTHVWQSRRPINSTGGMRQFLRVQVIERNSP